MISRRQYKGLIFHDRLTPKFKPAFIMTLGLLLALVILAGVVQAQTVNRPANANSDKWYLGYNGFRMLLEQRGLTVRMDLSATLRRPKESVIVVFGDVTRISRDEWLQMRAYVAQGGSLLVASEQSFKLPGVTLFSRGPVASLDPDSQYQGFEDCIVLSNLNQSHPLSKGLRRIIVNKTGWMSTSEDSSLQWEVIAALTEDVLPGSARHRPVIMAGIDAAPGTGVLILSADQSLFSDGMLWHGDNSLFAIQVSDLLCRGNRKWVTVYDSGQTLPSYVADLNPSPNSPPLPPDVPPNIPPEIDPPEPDLATMLRMANEVVDEVQDSNILNETLKERPRNMSPVAWARTILLILLILFLLFVLWRLIQNRWHLIPNRHARFLQSMYGVHSSRQLETSEFGAAVEILARDLCRELTGSQVESDWLKLLAPNPDLPSATFSRSQRKALREVVGIAMRGCRVHISRRKFQSLGSSIDAIRTAWRSDAVITTGN
ncbi:MAG: DUF4350 domain-containing protein [Planctomycetaceae bacterium]